MFVFILFFCFRIKVIRNRGIEVRAHNNIIANDLLIKHFLNVPHMIHILIELDCPSTYALLFCAHHKMIFIFFLWKKGKNAAK